MGAIFNAPLLEVKRLVIVKSIEIPDAETRSSFIGVEAGMDAGGLKLDAGHKSHGHLVASKIDTRQTGINELRYRQTIDHTSLEAVKRGPIHEIFNVALDHRN